MNVCSMAHLTIAVADDLTGLFSLYRSLFFLVFSRTFGDLSLASLIGSSTPCFSNGSILHIPQLFFVQLKSGLKTSSALPSFGSGTNLLAIRPVASALTAAVPMASFCSARPGKKSCWRLIRRYGQKKLSLVLSIDAFGTLNP